MPTQHSQPLPECAAAFARGEEINAAMLKALDEHSRVQNEMLVSIYGGRDGTPGILEMQRETAKIVWDVRQSQLKEAADREKVAAAKEQEGKDALVRRNQFGWAVALMVLTAVVTLVTDFVKIRALTP